MDPATYDKGRDIRSAVFRRGLRRQRYSQRGQPVSPNRCRISSPGTAMAARLAGAGHRLVVYDTRDDVMKQAVASGSHAASSPRDVADRVDNVFASLPSLQAFIDVATGSGGVIAGSKVKRFIDLSTVGSSTAQRISQQLAERGIAMLDCPVSGGVDGATNGTLAMMVSGPRPEF